MGVTDLLWRDWPDFTWDQTRLARAESLFAEGAGMVIGSSRHLDDTSRETLVVDIMSHEDQQGHFLEDGRYEPDYLNWTAGLSLIRRPRCPVLPGKT